MRAFISMLMPAGFYVLAAVQLALIGAAIWFVGLNGSVGLSVAFTGTAAAVAWGTWKAIRTPPVLPAGPALEEADAPELFATVRELAEEAGTRAPDEVYLIADVNAGVTEHGRFLGLAAGPRHLYVGLPLLRGLTVAQLRSVIAHELGHYSGRDTRHAGVAYRGRLAVERTIRNISPGNMVGWTFRGYARLYHRVQAAVSRRQEFAADRAAVRAGGRAAATSALEEVQLLSAAMALYMDGYVGPGLEAGFAPADLFGPLEELRREREADLQAVRAAARPDPGDSHPPSPERLAAMAAAPDPGVAAADDRAATVLLADPDAAAKALMAHVLPGKQLKRLAWDAFRSVAANAALQAEPDTVMRAVSRAVRRPIPHAGSVLDHIGAERGAVIAAGLWPHLDRPTALARLAEPAGALIALAAVRSKAAYWEHSWTESSRLLAKDGSPLPVEELGRLAAAPGTLPHARARLAELGIDPKAARHVQQVRNAAGSRILGGIQLMKVDRRRSDVLVLDHGLLVLPAVSRLKARFAFYRMDRWLDSGDLKTLAALPGSRFIAYEDIAEIGRRGDYLPRWRLTLHDGSQVEVRRTTETRGHGDAEILLRRALG